MVKEWLHYFRLISCLCFLLNMTSNDGCMRTINEGGFTLRVKPTTTPAPVSLFPSRTIVLYSISPIFHPVFFYIITRNSAV